MLLELKKRLLTTENVPRKVAVKLTTGLVYRQKKSNYLDH